MNPNIHIDLLYHPADAHRHPSDHERVAHRNRRTRRRAAFMNLWAAIFRKAATVRSKLHAFGPRIHDGRTRANLWSRQ